ncbi:MAG: type II secretion system protein [Pseudomonadota bacterium]
MKRTVIHSRPAAGFSLVELLAVLAIVGTLAAAIMPLGETMLAAQRERELRHALWEIRAALDAYRHTAQTLGLVTDAAGAASAAGASGYPPSLKALVDGLPDPRPQAQGQRIPFLRSIPRDPFADPALPPEATWRLRSYASPADRPEPGDDVFDVKSSSQAVGLDGSRHDSW